MAEESISELDDLIWESRVEKSPDPVVVMFYSPLCRHCIQILPFVEELAGEFTGVVSFGKLNVTRFSWMAERFGVMGTPAFFAFCGGKPVQMRLCVVFPPMLRKMVEEVVEHGDECRLRSTELKYDVSGYG